MNATKRWAKTRGAYAPPLALIGLIVALGGAARAQESPLAIVPGTAPIVVQLHGFEKARNHLGKFLGNSLPDIAPKLAKQMDDAIKDLAAGRDLKAIDQDGRLFLVVPDLNNLDESPQFAILIPVGSAAKFKDGFLKADERKSLKKQADGVEAVTLEGKDDPFYLVERKDYVIIANDKDVAKGFVKGDAGLGKTLSKETAKAFLDQDVSVYVNLKAINKQYGAKIRGFKTLIDLALMGGGMGIDKKQIELVKNLFNSFLALLDDGEAAVLGFEFRNEGANFHFMAQFGANTETNGFLQKLKPAPLKELGSLPAGQIMYSASNFDPRLSKTLSALMRTALASDEDEDANKGIQAALKDLADNGRTYEVSAYRTLAAGLEVSEYKDGAKAAASTLKMFEALSKTGSFGSIPLKEKPVVKEGAETVGDYKLNHVKLVFDFDKYAEHQPEATREASKAAVMKLMGDKTNVWFGNSGNKLISVTAKDWNEAKTTIENYLKGAQPLERDESFQSTRKHLPADATILMFADTARFIEVMLDAIKEALAGVPGIPGGAIPDLKAPKGKSAYFGMAVVLKNEYASFDLFVPVTAVQQVRKMFAPLIDGDN